MPGQKMYIVAKSDLIQASQKLPKVLSFYPVKAKFAARLCEVGQMAEDIIYKNINTDEGNTGIVIQSSVLTKAGLSSSIELNEINRQVVQEVTTSINQLISTTYKPTRVHLSVWLRRSLTSASTISVYGLQNPFKDHSVIDAF